MKRLSQRIIKASSATINGATLSLDVADTDDKRAKGLMKIKELPMNKGMLFVFDSVDHHGLWMQDTYVPLAALFLNRNDEIVDIQHMTPVSTRIHRPAVPVQKVIEVNSEFVDIHKVNVGDKVEFV